MNKKNTALTLLLICCLVFLAGCDPIYPPGNLKVERIELLSQGSSIEIEIIYPNTGGTIVFGWKDQCIEVIEGDDIVEVEGLFIKGIKPGIARLRVSATTVISDGAISDGKTEKVYSTEIEVRVK